MNTTGEEKEITIVGAGRLGGALALALARRGRRIARLIVRNREKAEPVAGAIDPPPEIVAAGSDYSISTPIVIIAAQDAALDAVVADLKDKIGGRETIVYHTSGALSSAILRPLAETGCSTGSIHPLVSVSDFRAGAESFRDVYFCVEGDDAARAEAEKLIGALEGKSFSIAAADKTLYHAAAVTACGHFVALIDAALEMLAGCGLDEATGRAVLLPLVRSTVENLAAQTTAEALTGTFARGDVGTFERHVEALGRTVSPQALAIYLELGERSAKLARLSGAKRENTDEIVRQISLAKKKFRC